MQSLPVKALLDTVETSPQAVAAHDKSAWLALFDRSFHLEDPVGSRPVDNVRQLEQFYESFIAPNTIRFIRGRDYAGCEQDGCYSVWRDLALEIDLSDDVSVTVPMHLHYQVRTEHDSYKVSRLAAHWALWPMIKQLVPFGLKAISTGLRLSGNIWRNLGWFGLSGFGLALLTPASSHEKLLAAVLGGQYPIALQDSRRQPLEQQLLQTYRAEKTVCAGRFITASLYDGSERALLVLARAHRLGEITSAQLFTNSDCVNGNSCA